MSFKCKNESGCMYYKIDPNKQCTFCYPHVGIASSIVELHCTKTRCVHTIRMTFYPITICHGILPWSPPNVTIIKTH